jgi:DNA sulfur modification protein DndD
MKFEKLIIRNFSSYYGEHELELNTDDEKTVVIIIGGNGFGKTSIFQAINWALYGEDYERDLNKYYNKKIADYINESAFSEGLREVN